MKMARYVVFWGYKAGDGFYYQAEPVDNILVALRRAGEVHGFVIPTAMLNEVIEKLREAAEL